MRKKSSLLWRLMQMEQPRRRSAGVAVSTTAFDPSNKSTHITLSGANLIATSGVGSTNATNVGSVASHTSGKYYAEFTLTTKAGGASTAGVGVGNGTFAPDGTFLGGTSTQSCALYDDGTAAGQTSGTLTGLSFVQGNIIGMALDIGAKKIWWRVNGGNWNNSATADPATNTEGLNIGDVIDTNSTIKAYVEGEVNTDVWTANFGGSAYGAAAPSGFGNW